jgi:type II protein arginine methyltransferase
VTGTLPQYSPPSDATDVELALASMQAYMDDLSQRMTSASEALAAVSSNVSAPSPDIHNIAASTIPRWHFAMLNDHERNDAFAEAMARQVRPGSHVLDIGSGAGLLAMMAADAGAGRVTTCEANPVLAEIARRVVAEHGMSDVITVVNKWSTDLVVGEDIPRRADLIVSEIVDCGLIGEGMFPTMRHARTELLADGGQLVPETARIYGALVEGEVVASLNRVTTAGGYDVRLLNTVATQGHFPVRLSTWPHRVLSESTLVSEFDIRTDPLVDGQRTISFPVLSDGLSHGAVVWFEIDLDEKVTLRNPPDNVGSHWMQALLLFGRPVPVAAGSTLEVDLCWKNERLMAFPQTPDNSV